MRLSSYYYVATTLLDWTLSCFAAPRPCPSLIQITCVIFTDDLWRKKITKTNCVGGCQCGLWYCVLVEEIKKNLTSAPTLVPFQRCHSIKDRCLQTLQKCRSAPRQNGLIFLCQQKYNYSWSFVRKAADERDSYTGRLHSNCSCVQNTFADMH